MARSRQSYLETLENHNRIYSKEFSIQLQQNTQDLGKLLSYYKPSNTDSNKKLSSGIISFGTLKDHKVSKDGSIIAQRLAKKSNLDEIQAYEIYWNYQKTTTQTLLLLNDKFLSTVFLF